MLKGRLNFYVFIKHPQIIKTEYSYEFSKASSTFFLKKKALKKINIFKKKSFSKI